AAPEAKGFRRRTRPCLGAIVSPLQIAARIEQYAEESITGLQGLTRSSASPRVGLDLIVHGAEALACPMLLPDLDSGKESDCGAIARSLSAGPINPILLHSRIARFSHRTPLIFVITLRRW